ncbi:MAG: hypothetical protein ABIN80_23005 [Dyadobacter sp.]|uniref:hypothetical protein n=1 Tax=Dyadobacter sp. TaxID=1914288 RepID=UPI00326698BC
MKFDIAMEIDQIKARLSGTRFRIISETVLSANYMRILVETGDKIVLEGSEIIVSGPNKTDIEILLGEGNYTPDFKDIGRVAGKLIKDLAKFFGVSAAGGVIGNRVDKRIEDLENDKPIHRVTVGKILEVPKLQYTDYPLLEPIRLALISDEVIRDPSYLRPLVHPLSYQQRGAILHICDEEGISMQDLIAATGLSEYGIFLLFHRALHIIPTQKTKVLILKAINARVGKEKYTVEMIFPPRSADSDD